MFNASWKFEEILHIHLDAKNRKWKGKEPHLKWSEELLHIQSEETSPRLNETNNKAAPAPLLIHNPFLAVKMIVCSSTICSFPLCKDKLIWSRPHVEDLNKQQRWRFVWAVDICQLAVNVLEPGKGFFLGFFFLLRLRTPLFFPPVSSQKDNGNG